MKRILLFMGILGFTGFSHAQFVQSFEGATTIPTGWTVINGGDAANTWTVVDFSTSTTLTAQNGTNAATIKYGTSAHNDFLITPAITVGANSNYISFWGRSRDPLYPETIALKVSTTTATAAAFTTTLIPSVAPASGPNFVNYTYNLSAYAGQTIYIGFHSTTTDKFYFDLDNVVVSALPTCGTPSNPTVTGTTTATTANLSWTAPTVGTPVGYEVQYGPTGFTMGTGTTVSTTSPNVSLTSLTEGTSYQYYVRTKCSATDFSTWAGPIAFTTPYNPATLPYTYGFETDNLDGWGYIDGATGGYWDTYQTGVDAPAQAGTIFLGAIGSDTAASDSWVFSRALNVPANTTVTIQYYVQEVVFAGDGGINNLRVTAGTANTIAGQTITLSPTTDITNTTYALKSHTFTSTAAGTYYVGFNYTAPIQTAVNNGALALDSFSATGALGTDEIFASQFTVFPNPATNVVNITNADNILVNGVSIVDINGRTVKTAKFDAVSEAQVNIADLSAGVYMMTVSSDKGTMTKKIVKQ